MGGTAASAATLWLSITTLQAEREKNAEMNQVEMNLALYIFVLSDKIQAFDFERHE